MRNSVMGTAAVAVVVLATPALAADLPLYRDGASYPSQSYREPAPHVRVAPRGVDRTVVRETIVVRRPIVVARPRVIIEEYPVYAAPMYAPPVVAYGGPVYAHRWGPRRHFVGHRFWGGRRHFAGRW
jgi:hypothetical protein